MTQQQSDGNDPFEPGAGLRIRGFDDNIGIRPTAFFDNVESGFGPYFEGIFEPLAFPDVDVDQRSRLTLSNEQLVAVFWQFNGVHTKAVFRTLRAEDPPRRISIAGVHLMGREGGAVIRLFDEAGLMAQLGVLPSSRRLGPPLAPTPEAAS